MPNAWKRWIEAFWFLRGIAAAMTIATFVPQITNLKRFEFLRAFHALIVRWNDFAAWLGSLIGRIPFIPELSADFVNCAIFILAIGLPAGMALALHYEERSKLRGTLLGRLGALSGLLLTSTIAGMLYLLASAAARDWNGAMQSTMSWPDIAALSIWAVFLLAVFVYALFTLKGYAKGLFVVVTFIVSMQVLYWLNTPWLTDQINTTVESAMREDS